MNGEGVSACDPVILNNRKVGLMMNTRWEKGRLRSEAWIDRGRANTVDERIMTAVEAKEMMELSTGIFIDVDDTEGTWRGEEYTGVARNYRPDHLALLPDQIGACSLADGAGLLRNQSADLMAKAKKMMKTAQDNGDEEMRKKAKQMMDEAKAMVTKNEMSMSNINSALCEALRTKFNVDPAVPSTGYLWVMDVYSNFVIYEFQNKLWRLGYTAADTGVTLSDETPVEVRRVTEYRTVTGAFVGNRNIKSQFNMNKQKIVAILMAHAVTTVAGIALAANMTEEQMKPLTDEALEGALNEALNKPAAPPAPVANAVAPEKEKGEEGTKVVNLADYIAAAPKEIQDVLRNSMTVYDEEKVRLIETITANKNNIFTKEDLSARPLNELRALSRLAGGKVTTTANYAGQAPVPAGNAEAEEALEIPVLNFATK